MRQEPRLSRNLVSNKYIALNKKTQIVTPTLTGEMIVNVVSASIGSLLNPTLTASWEKGSNLRGRRKRHRRRVHAEVRQVCHPEDKYRQAK